MDLNETLKNYVEETFFAPDFTLYHYTNFGKEIINSKQLRMSLHEELNKKNNRELKIGPELANEKLIKSSLYRLRPLFNEYIKRGIKIYVASFCEEENYLHAIQQYGEDCIGIKGGFAKQFCNSNSAILGNVKYDINEQKRIISEMFGLYESSPESPQEKICSLFLWLSVIFPLLKEEVDQNDNECRIITAEGRDPNDPQKLVGECCAKKIKFELENIIISRIHG